MSLVIHHWPAKGVRSNPSLGPSPPHPPPHPPSSRGDLKWKRSHFRLTCVAQKRLCLSSLFNAFEISVYFCWSFFGRMKNKVRIIMKYIFMSFIVVWFFVSCWWRCFKSVLMASLSAPRAHTRSVRQEWRARWLPPPVKKWNFLNQGNLEKKGQGVSTSGLRSSSSKRQCLSC